MSEMIERVARAMVDAWIIHQPRGTMPDMPYWRDMARSAIEALRAALFLEHAVTAGDSNAARQALEQVTNAQRQGHQHQADGDADAAPRQRRAATPWETAHPPRPNRPEGANPCRCDILKHRGTEVTEVLS